MSTQSERLRRRLDWDLELAGLHRLGQAHIRAGDVGDSPEITIMSATTTSGSHRRVDGC